MADRWTGNNSFTLGQWHVVPDLSQISDGNQTRRLEPRVMKALTALAKADGQLVSRDELFAQIWPNQDITDQTLSSLISQLRGHLNDSPRDPRVIGTVPKKGYRLLQPVLPAITADCAADAAVAGQSDLLAGNDKKASSGRLRWWLFVLLSVALAAIVVGLNQTQKTAAPAAALPAPASVAVLPFVNMSAGADDSYFSDGIAEELLNQLANVRGLRVVSRTSSFRFRERAEASEQIDIRDIGQQLNARFVLEGSVRRDKDQVRVTVQLINAQTGYHSWSQTFDGQWRDLFSLQEDITRSVVGQISPQLLPGNTAFARPATTAAYDFYLQGLYWWNQRTPASLRRSSELFQQAIALEPDYALAYTGLADSYLSQHYYGGQPAEVVVVKAQSALRRALALEPKLPEAHLAMGNLYSLQTDWRQAEASLKQALSLNPNLAMAHMSLGNVLNQTGRLSDAYQSYRSAALQSPLHPTVAMNLAQVATKLGFFDIAIKHLDVVTEVAPDHPYLFGLQTHVFLSAGRPQPARQALNRWLQRQSENSPNNTPAQHADNISCGRAAVFLQAMAIARSCLESVVNDLSLTAVPQYQMEALTQLAWLEISSGNSTRAQKLLEAAIEYGLNGQVDMPLEEAIAFELGVAYALAGEVGRGLLELRRSIELGRRDLGWVQNDRRLDGLRDNAEFSRLTQQLESLQADLRARSEVNAPMQLN